MLGPVLLFALSLPRYIFFGSDRYSNVLGQKLASLSSISAFCFGAGVFADYEYAEVGIGWANIAEGDYSLLTCLQFMAFDGVLYLLLAAYFDAVVPSQFGSPRHPLFFLSPLKIRLMKVLRLCGLAENSCKVAPVLRPSNPSSRNQAEEEPISSLIGAPAVIIRELVKDYHKESMLWKFVASLFRARGATGDNSNLDHPTRAVDGLNLNLWPNQVTTLLGHNGAGKSTTVSILTGLTPPSSGDATVFGKSIVHDLSGVRRSLGVCPQTNVIFPQLTVSQHLWFFARVKGVKNCRRAVEAVIEDVGLTEKRNIVASALSGGMKRKLCLAVMSYSPFPIKHSFFNFNFPTCDRWL